MNSRKIAKALRLRWDMKVEDYYYSTVHDEADIEAIKFASGIKTKLGQFFAVISFRRRTP